MPYIKAERRAAIDLLGETPATKGELTYAITVLAVRYVKLRGKTFDILGDVVAAFEQAKDEFQRRVIHPYEDDKIQENGDVYEDIAPPRPCPHGKELCGCRNVSPAWTKK